MVSRSHKAQCGFLVRPSKALGSLDRRRLGLIGSGLAGVAEAVTPGLDEVRCNMMKSQMIANRASW